MYFKLKAHEQQGRRIRVGIIGLGAMGRGVAWQVARTPGMEVVFIGDIKETAIQSALSVTGGRGVPVTNAKQLPPRAAGEVYTTTDCLALLTEDNGLEFDALVECTNSLVEGAHFCLAAIARKAHVVLMNAEIDLAFGSLLAHEAAKNGVVVTSDAGDQHGVLATMADEIRLWGFRIVQAGNMKGFQDRHANADHARPWAEKQKLSLVQTVSYTDGTKMNIEQAIIGNYLDLTPFIPGMEGPRCADLREVLDKFDFDKYGEQGRVDYTLGVPWPGGGVYIVGHCDDADQDFLLKYYKVSAKTPYYLFFRPYHLCHIETPRAIAQAYFDHRAVITPPQKKLNDVYAWAKKDVTAGTPLEHAIGSDECYGLVETTASADARGGIPICWLMGDHGAGALAPKLKVNLKKDEPVCLQHVDLPDTATMRLVKRQQAACG